MSTKEKQRPPTVECDVGGTIPGRGKEEEEKKITEVTGGKNEIQRARIAL